MITAREAKNKSIINSKGKKYLDALEKKIENAVEAGNINTSIPIDLRDVYTEKEVSDAVVDKLLKLGYKVDIQYAKPLPARCPSDQWDFNNGTLSVDWSE